MINLSKFIKRTGIIAGVFLTVGTLSPSLSQEVEQESTYQQNNTGDDVPQWGETVAINNPDYDKSWSARFRSFFRKPIVCGPTIAITAIGFSAGVYFLYINYDPTVFSKFLSQKFFNDSLMGMEPETWRYDTNVPYPNCFDSCTAFPIPFIPHANFENDPYRGPGYLTWKPDKNIEGAYGSVFNKGNLSDMIKTIQHLCGCDNYQHWYDYAVSIINGDKFDPAIAHCVPNNDNQTMCCGSGWGWYTHPNWRPNFSFGNLSIRMVNGSGVCAQADEHSSWAGGLGSFSAFGALLPTTAVGLGIWSRFFGK